MPTLSAKIRKEVGKKVKTLRKKGVLPAVLYGPKIKSQPLRVEAKEFKKTYQEAGERTLVDLEVPEEKKKYLVLIHEIKRHPTTGEVLHIDFYQPSLEEKIEAKVPIVLEGEAPAVKSLGGTLIKNIPEVEVKALPQNLPKEFKLNIEGLKTFEDHLLIRDLQIPAGVEIQRGPEEIAVSVAPPEKVEEELAKPVEEKVEEVEKVEKEKKEKEVPELKEEKQEAAPAGGESRPKKSGREKKQ